MASSRFTPNQYWHIAHEIHANTIVCIFNSIFLVINHNFVLKTWTNISKTIFTIPSDWDDTAFICHMLIHNITIPFIILQSYMMYHPLKQYFNMINTHISPTQSIKPIPVPVVTAFDNGRLTHHPQGKMTATSQTIFSDTFSWTKSFIFWLKFPWS